MIKNNLSNIHDNVIFCKDCNKTDSYDKYLENIFKTDFGYHFSKCSHCGGVTIPIDEDLFEILYNLNNKGYKTVSSCIGTQIVNSSYQGILYISFKEKYEEIIKYNFKTIKKEIDEHFIILRKKEDFSLEETWLELFDFSKKIVPLSKKKEQDDLITKVYPNKKDNSSINFFINSSLSSPLVNNKFNIIKKDTILTKKDLHKIRKSNTVIEDINSLKNILPLLTVYKFKYPIDVIVPMNIQKEKNSIPTFSGWGSFQDKQTYGLYKILKLMFQTNTYINFNKKIYLMP